MHSMMCRLCQTLCLVNGHAENGSLELLIVWELEKSCFFVAHQLLSLLPTNPSLFLNPCFYKPHPLLHNYLFILLSQEKMLLFTPYVLVLFWVHCFTPMVLSFNLVDEFALIALKAHITYDSQGMLATNWSTKSSHCSWYGISCNAPQQRVSAINLSNMGLEGTIAPQVGNLSFLVSLDLSNNYFHGSLPKDIGKILINFVYFMSQYSCFLFQYLTSIKTIHFWFLKI